MSFRSKSIRRLPKSEKELTITTKSSIYKKNKSTISRRAIPDDYQAPLINSRFPNSKWNIVRNNLHKIRSIGVFENMSIVAPPHRNWYLYFQIRRELTRAESQIRGIQNQPNFKPIHYFILRGNKSNGERFNVSHVRPTDGIYYAGLGTEPIILQHLLYYFNKEYDMSKNKLYDSLLYDINLVLSVNRQRVRRFVILRRFALIMAIALFAIILIMLFSLILSVLTTVGNINSMYKNDTYGGIRPPQSKTFLPTKLFYKL